MSRILSSLLVAGVLSVAAHAQVQAQAQAPAPEGETPVDEIVVSGEYPGPGMWKVTRAGDPAGNALWIVGDPPPLPKRMQWKSREVEARMLASQEILLDAGVSMQPDEKIGFFKGISLVPAALKARKNPGKESLKELVPADLYARWLVQKKKFLGRDSGVEEFRPIFAADKLRRAAFDELDLREGGVVWQAVEKLAKKEKIRTTHPQLVFKFRADEIRAKIKEFQKESLADTECFAATLSLTEALSNREVEAARARAWATADLEALAALPPLPNAYLPCIMAVMGSQVAQEVIPADVREQVYTKWLEAAMKSLGENASTFAIVPLGKLTAQDGYLARLQERGYLVEAPR